MGLPVTSSLLAVLCAFQAHLHWHINLQGEDPKVPHDGDSRHLLPTEMTLPMVVRDQLALGVLTIIRKDRKCVSSRQ